MPARGGRALFSHAGRDVLFRRADGATQGGRGQGAASIAARAGISVETLYELNPDHMTSGYWYANPGDEVYIN